MNNKFTRKVLGNNVKHYRFKNGFSQELLAEKANISPRYINDIENGKGNVPIDTLEILAEVLNTKPYLLIKEQKHKTLPKRVNMK